MGLKLSKADNIILKNIAYNSRILEKVLAKKCNLSKDSIRYRIHRLETSGIITGYSNFIDYKILGYKSFKLYIKLNATIEQKQELIKFLKSQPQVFSIFESHGNWDLGLAIFAKSNIAYYQLENELLFKFGNIINNKNFCIMLDAIIINGNLIYKDNETQQFSFWKEITPPLEIDEKDKLILNILNKNSRENLVNLSQKVKLSIDSVSKRIKKLKEDKIITFYSTKIDYNALGFEKYKLFLYAQNYSDEAEEKLIRFFKGIKNTINIIRIIGPWKLEIEFLIEKHQEFEEILSELQKNFSKNIQRLEYFIYRNDTYPPSENILI
ncbi:MAG: winged helix-turn-helix transcriptional regulator [Candidatus Parcubacteria bacterium]|nr:winged helix-turn-helix transcriptional regulator [Candidatus Parcubacteria bacterium]